MMQKLRALIAIVAAVAYTLAGVGLLMSSSKTALVSAGAFGSAGLGAVSIGISELLGETLLFVLLAYIANRMLAAWARGSSVAVKRLHRLHWWSIPVMCGVTVAGTIAAVTTWGVAGFSLTGILWGLQLLLTAVLLMTYAVRTFRTA